MATLSFLVVEEAAPLEVEAMAMMEMEMGVEGEGEGELLEAAL